MKSYLFRKVIERITKYFIDFFAMIHLQETNYDLKCFIKMGLILCTSSFFADFKIENIFQTSKQERVKQPLSNCVDTR